MVGMHQQTVLRQEPGKQHPMPHPKPNLFHRRIKRPTLPHLRRHHPTQRPLRLRQPHRNRRRQTPRPLNPQTIKHPTNPRLHHTTSLNHRQLQPTPQPRPQRHKHKHGVDGRHREMWLPDSRLRSRIDFTSARYASTSSDDRSTRDGNRTGTTGTSGSTARARAASGSALARRSQFDEVVPP